jgi:hypothetical protein
MIRRPEVGRLVSPRLWMALEVADADAALVLAGIRESQRDDEMPRHSCDDITLVVHT